MRSLQSRRGDHSSRPWFAPRLQQPTRGFSIAAACAATTGACAQRAGPALPSYLALHHAGFSVPRLSPNERWALTPPFHPYRGISFRGRLAGFPARCHRAPFHRRFIFCGTFREPHRTHDVRRSPPDVIRRVALTPKPTKWTAGRRFPTLRPETSVSGLSSRLPWGPQDRRVAPPIPTCSWQTSDHPAHPL